jgi:hypothetical protein
MLNDKCTVAIAVARLLIPQTVWIAAKAAGTPADTTAAPVQSSKMNDLMLLQFRASRNSGAPNRQVIAGNQQYQRIVFFAR